jgi:hypothetical protein
MRWFLATCEGPKGFCSYAQYIVYLEFTDFAISVPCHCLSLQMSTQVHDVVNLICRYNRVKRRGTL